MAWPDDTAIDRNDFTDDADIVTGASGARADLLDLLDRFNLVLASITPGANPLTDQNSGDYMKKVDATTPSEICLLDASGHPIRSQKTIVGAVTGSANVPTDAAVKTYVDNGLAAAAPFQASCFGLNSDAFESGNNIASVDAASGTWTITFTNPFLNENYIVLATPESPFEYMATVIDRSTTRVVIGTYDENGQAANPSGLHLAIIGTLA